MRLTGLLTTFVAVTLMLAAASAMAAVPQTINYQGRLTDDQGDPVTATVSMVFTIYDQASGGIVWWTETHASVLVTDGLFNVILGGSTEPIDDSVFVDPDRYLGIAVNGDPEIEPRTRLISVPFAYRSVKSDTADYVAGGVGDADWVIDGDNIYRDNGKVGIGTDSPEMTLSVRDGSQTLQAIFGQGRTSGHSAIAIGEEDALNKAFFIRYDHDNNRAFMHIAGDPVSAFVTVAGGGNVGIGSTNPVAKLEVAGSVQMWGFGMATGASAGHVLTSNATGVGTWQPAGNIGGSGTINYIPKFTAATTLGNTGIYETDGKVNIGSGSPNETKLNVSGTSPQITIRDSGTGVNQKIGVDGNGLSLHYDGGASLTVNRSNGKIGIGKSDPTRSLDVAGDGSFLESDPNEVLRVENTRTDGGNAIYAVNHASDVYAAAISGKGASTSGDNYGVLGVTMYNSLGNLGSSAGVYGRAASETDGGDAFGVLGECWTRGGHGDGPNAAAGVYGISYTTNGKNYGVFGETMSLDTDMAGVYGIANPESDPSNAKVHGVLGLTGSNTAGSAGVYGVSGPSGYTFGVYGRQDSPSGKAAKFEGDVEVTGTISKGGGGFKIDHPLDPQNQWLYHSFVESPDMMNIYNGNVTLDANGTATVELPEYFLALNMEFRYQLTAVGAPGPNLYIAREISDNSFEISGGEPGLKVSWQVTGIRHDKWAEANRIQVEVEKKPHEIGLYRHPELYGLDQDKAIDK